MVQFYILTKSPYKRDKANDYYNKTEISQKSHIIPTNSQYRQNILKTVGGQEGKRKELINA